MAKNLKKSAVLVKRRAKRGRPRKDERCVKLLTIPVFIARDPQGIKLFASEPKRSVLGVWEGRLVHGTKAMDPRMFVMRFRNARLPERGNVLEMRMGV